MIILDTNVVSQPLRTSPHPGVVEWLDAQALETLYLTAMTLAEVRYGIELLPDGRRKRTLSRGFEEEWVPLFAGRILNFDDAASRSYARLRARARAMGMAIGDMDALIGAIADANGHAVATRDVAPFEALGIGVINPFE